MATRDEMLRSLVDQVAALTKRVSGLSDRLAKIEADPWNEPLQWMPADTAESVGSTESPPPGPAPPTAPAFEKPPTWDQMDSEARARYIATMTETPLPDDMFRAKPETETVTVRGNVQVHFPKPDEQSKQEWAQEAAKIMENIKPDNKKGTTLDGRTMEAKDAYAVGGPLWLAAYDHEFLMGLPQEMRQRMVTQVARYAPQEARNLGRDILRVDTERQKAHAYANAEKASDDRAGSYDHILNQAEVPSE